jgi:undecaprenyl-diphosphatase
VLDVMRAPGNPAEPIGPLWFDAAIFVLTALGSYAVLGVVSLYASGFLLLSRQPGKAVLLGAALGGGVVLCETL